MKKISHNVTLLIIIYIKNSLVSLQNVGTTGPKSNTKEKAITIRFKSGTKRDEFLVYVNIFIVHGDFWLNNMMFEKDEAGNPTKVIIIDYQVNRQQLI